MRRLRARRRAGLQVVAVEVDGDLIGELVRLRLIGPEDAADGEAVAAALGDLLGRLFRIMRDASRAAPEPL